MASNRARLASRDHTFGGRSPRARPALILLPFVLAALVAVARAIAPGPPTLLALTSGVENATPEQLSEIAADALETATAPGGTGYRFEIIQTSTIVAKPGGPLVSVPSEAGRGSAGTTERYFLNSLIERGVARPDVSRVKILGHFRARISVTRGV